MLRMFGQSRLFDGRFPADRDDRHRPVHHRRVAALLADVLWLVWWVAPDSEESSFRPDGMVRTLRC